VPNYLPWAIVSAILWVPGGIVAIIYSVLVNRRLAAGDWEGASRASRLARVWCLISVAVAALVVVLLASGAIRNPYASG
jgi:Na+-driven multidrug efflux pump